MENGKWEMTNPLPAMKDQRLLRLSGLPRKRPHPKVWIDNVLCGSGMLSAYARFGVFAPVEQPYGPIAIFASVIFRSLGPHADRWKMENDKFMKATSGGYSKTTRPGVALEGSRRKCPVPFPMTSA